MNTNTPNESSSQYRKNMSKQIAVAFFSDCDILRPKMENWMRRMVRVHDSVEPLMPTRASHIESL